MNWKEFKEKVERKGVVDDMEIDYIDTDLSWFEVHIDRERNSFSIL
jgi:hypothetical protein